MELKRYARIVLKWWWLTALCFLVLTIGSFAFSFSQAPRYRATITLVVSPKESGELSAVRQSLDTLDKPMIINTYTEVIHSRQIYNLAQDSLGLDDDQRDQVTIQATTVQKTNLVVIDAEGTDPLLTQQMANAVTNQAIDYIDDLYELYDIKVLDAAETPTKPISPNVPRDTALGAGVGLLLGLGLSFVGDYLQKSIDAWETSSIIDAETGLYRKNYFLQRAREEISRSGRNARPLTGCLLRLRDLSSVDEERIKQAYSNVRLQAIHFLRRQMRSGEILAAWKPDQIAWLMLDADETAAELAIQRVRSNLENAVFKDEDSGMRFFFTAIFGAAVYEPGTSDIDWMSRAEEALLAAENSGVNSYLIRPRGAQASVPANGRDSVQTGRVDERSA